MKAFQIYPFVLRTPTYTAGGSDTVSLESLPTRVMGRIAHVVGFTIDVLTTPTFTGAPTTLLQLHSIIQNLTFFDGAQERHNSSLWDIRSFEILEAGRVLIPEPSIAGATTNPVGLRRHLPVGPWGFEGFPTDWAIPCASLKSGEIRLSYGALTDYSALTTAINANIRITANLVLLDNEIRLPAAFERRTYNFGTTEAVIQGKALYTSLAIAKQANTAFSAGDLSTITYDTGLGQTPQVIASTHTAMAQYYLESGHINQLSGEPRSATDVNTRIVNPATPTALTAPDFFLQPVVYSPYGSRISKLFVEATSALRVSWTGTFTTPKVLVARILETPLTAYASMGVRAASGLGMMPTAGRTKTLDKTDYKGPRELYMPKVAKF